MQGQAVTFQGQAEALHALAAALYGSSIARQHSDTATKESAIFFSGREGESARAAAIYEKIREEELVPQGAADRDIHALLSVWVRLGSPSN